MASGGGMRTPNSGSEITEAWVQYILTCYERRRDPQASVRVLHYRVRAGTKPGENVASELVKIWAEVELTGRRERKEDKEKDKKNQEIKNSEKEVERKEGEEKEKEKLKIKNKEDTKSKKECHTTTTASFKKEYHLMAKFNTGTEYDRQFIKYMNHDLNELLIYSDVIPHLNAWQEQVLKEKGEEGEALNKYKIQVPEFVYGVCTYDEYVLVMQDVSVLGYATEDKILGMDLPHVLMAADRLAGLHATSYAFHQTHDFFRHYPSFDTEEPITLVVEFIFVTVNLVVKMASQRPEFAPIVQKMEEKHEAMKARLTAAMIRGNPKNRVVCLVHGDYWTNNLMYSHEGEGKTPKDLMLIDWGLLAWRNPIRDLHKLVFNCTTRSFRQQHLQDVLKRYHSTFTVATTALGAPVHGYDFDAFLKEWRRTAICGFLHSGLFANAIVLSRTTNEGFLKKGTPSYGLKGMALRVMARVMVPLVLRGWFMEAILTNRRERCVPLLEEMLSGENLVLNTRLLELMKEAYEEGVMDE